MVRDLKYKITTNEEGKVELRHPRRGKIYVDQKSGSPLMDEGVRRELIKEMEEFSKQRKDQDKEINSQIGSVKQILMIMESELGKSTIQEKK